MRLRVQIFAVCALVVGGALLGFAIEQCGPINPTPSDGGVISTPTSWVDTVQVSVDVLIVAVPAAVAVVQALPIPAQAKVDIVNALVSAQGSLPGISAALARYQTSPSSDNACRARAAIQLVADSLLAVAQGLTNAGFQAPAQVLTSLGGLAAVIDEFVPVCAPDAGAPQVQFTQRVLHAVAPPVVNGVPATLHPFPSRAP
jgi:hypothetical protein